MRRCIALLLVIAAVTVADEATQLQKKARQLEKRAGKLLDAGQKEKALDLILKAAEMRQRARDARAAPDAAKPVAPATKLKPAKAKRMAPTTRPMAGNARVAGVKRIE